MLGKIIIPGNRYFIVQDIVLAIECMALIRFGVQLNSILNVGTENFGEMIT